MGRYRLSLIAITKNAKIWPHGGEGDLQASSLSAVLAGRGEAGNLQPDPWAGSGCGLMAKLASVDLTFIDRPRVRYKKACFMEHLLGTSTDERNRKHTGRPCNGFRSR